MFRLCIICQQEEGLTFATESYINDKGKWNLGTSRVERKVIAWMYRDEKPAPYGEKKVVDDEE